MRDPHWNKFLLEVYRSSRNMDGWPDIYHCHDEEDQAYFNMLDSEIEAQRLKQVEDWKPIDLEIWINQRIYSK